MGRSPPMIASHGLCDTPGTTLRRRLKQGVLLLDRVPPSAGGRSTLFQRPRNPHGAPHAV